MIVCNGVGNKSTKPILCIGGSLKQLVQKRSVGLIERKIEVSSNVVHTLIGYLIVMGRDPLRISPWLFCTYFI